MQKLISELYCCSSPHRSSAASTPTLLGLCQTSTANTSRRVDRVFGVFWKCFRGLFDNAPAQWPNHSHTHVLQQNDMEVTREFETLQKYLKCTSTAQFWTAFVILFDTMNVTPFKLFNYMPARCVQCGDDRVSKKTSGGAVRRARESRTSESHKSSTHTRLRLFS